MKTLIDTSAKVDSIVKVMMIEHMTQTIEEKEPTNDQIGQTDVFVPTTQTQGEKHIILIDQGKSEEEKDIPKEKEDEAIHTLVNFPETKTPTKFL